MKYQFDIELRTLPSDRFDSGKEADQASETLEKNLIAGCPLEQDYYGVDVEVSPKLPSGYALIFTFSFKLLFEALSLEEAKGEIDWKIHEMVAGSLLAKSYRQKEPTLSDEQPGLDELLSWIDDDQPFCIQADASRYHIACAEAVYGAQAVDTAIFLSGNYSEDEIIKTPDLYECYPQDQEGNLLHVIYGYEWERDVRNAWANEEEIVAYCDSCRGSLYDEPREDEK